MQNSIAHFKGNTHLFLPWANFANILQEAFTHLDPKSAKMTGKQSAFFALL
jgi:hypothetical protein